MNTKTDQKAQPDAVLSSAELGARLQSEALIHAAKCRSWAAKTFNETPDAALCVEAGDRLLYAAQLLDAQALEIRRLSDSVAAERKQWIPVTERLPEKNAEVLIAFAGQCAIPATGQYTGSAFDSHGWCYPAENRGTANDGEDPVVTHWMALPEVTNQELTGPAPAQQEQR